MKRGIVKVLLIALIVAGASSTIFFVLPQYFDIQSEKVTYTGFPTYACTEPFDVSTCLNKTKMDGFLFKSNGLSVVDTGYNP